AFGRAGGAVDQTRSGYVRRVQDPRDPCANQPTHVSRVLTLPVVLSVAGSDAGGGAGIQADLQTFEAFGVFGTTAVTAITAQNTLGVSGVHPIPPEMVAAQIAAVASDLKPAALKTGMLATRQLVETVADALTAHSLPSL